MRSIDLCLIKPAMFIVAGFSLLFFVTYSVAQTTQQKEVLAPGYHALTFDAPKAGGYMLPVIELAGDGRILTMQGKSAQLHDLLGSKYVLLSFIYTQCADVNGCPLATFVTSRVQKRLFEEDELRDQVRFLSVSFDPKNDTPDALNRYASGFIQDDFDWQFITTTSEQDLRPILARYKQPIVREQNGQGQQTGVISHVLRVFLIDKKKQIRNIYSTSFLHPDTIINDLKTLALQDQRSNNDLDQAHSASIRSKADNINLHGAGDNKDGYDTGNYQTNNLSLSTRVGLQSKLLKYQSKPPLGLPPLALDPEDELTEAKVQLGRTLFYDRRLSHNETISCAMCHIPEQGFSSNELATAVGIEGRTVRRNAPSLYNAAYAKHLFHDARENSLAQQVWSPLLAHNEMGNPSIGYIVDKLRAQPKYIRAFSAAFNGQLPDLKNIGQAIASYEQTLVSGNSPFDRWHFAAEKDSMNKEAQVGYTLFTGKAGCISCHHINKDFALFSDYEVHNTGIGYLNSMSPIAKTRKILLAPGKWLEVDTSVIANSAETKPNDLGYYEISEDPADRWKYKTPSLRNVTLSAPYMHDGSLLTLNDVIQFYNRGGVANPLLDPRIKPLGLSKQEILQLEAFLNSLTGDNVDELISDAFAVSVGNRED